MREEGERKEGKKEEGRGRKKGVREEGEVLCIKTYTLVNDSISSSLMST